jgi:predicted RNA-binding protein with PIN domain
MTAGHIFIDGYSLLYRWKSGPHEGAEEIRRIREALVARLSEWQSWIGTRMTVVFDGQQGGRDPASRKGFEVVYTSGQSADGYIESIVLNAARPFELMVVTSDLNELQTVAARGGQAITCEEFLRRVEPLRGAVQKARKGRVTPRPYPPRLGDFFPGQ